MMSKTKHKPPLTPQVAVGAILIKEHRILLVKRKNEPGKGEWAIPGGSVKLGETLQEAVEREILEETGLRVKAKDPAYTFDFIERDDENRIQFHYVIIDLIADLIGGKLRPSDDAVDARWFSPEDIKEEGVTKSTAEFLRRIKFIH